MGIGKIELSEAQVIANKVREYITPAMVRVEIAGSIRREKPVVGDIELVAIVADQDKLIKLIGDVGQTIKPGVPGVIPWSPKPGAKYIRVRLEEGMNLDLFVASPENWGGLFLMRTGSASGSDGNAFNGFVPRAFKRWKTLSGGGRMTDAMPTMPDGTQLPVYEEQDFFDLLEMDFVPPVERADHKAIKKYIKVEA
jgi:DNA polymerase/3'-5' exonuclease PolX